VVALLLGAAAALAMGRLIAAVSRSLVPLAVVGAAAALLVANPREATSAFPLSAPLGYANANAAFFVQASVAALMVATIWRRVPARALAVGGAIAFALIPFAIGSVAAAFLVVVLPLAALALVGLRRARTAVTLCMAGFVLALVGTIVVGAIDPGRTRSGAVNRLLDATVTERRVVLWHEAAVIMAHHPGFGVGPGRFKHASPTARADRDARWAHHGFLQQGAETGIPGFAFLVLLFLWGFARLRSVPEADAQTAVGAVALAALGIHATMAALVGAAIGHRPGSPASTAVDEQ
jgi:O-antigen ligase